MQHLRSNPIFTGLLALLCILITTASDGKEVVSTPSEGPGWMITSVQGTDGFGPATEVYVAIGRQGLLNSPVPEQEKEKLLGSENSLGTLGKASIGDAGKANKKIYIIHKEIVDTFWGQGFVPGEYSEHARLACDDYMGQVAESFSPTIPLSGSLDFAEVSSGGSLELDGEISVAVEAQTQIDVEIEYEVGLTLCIPSSVSISYMDLNAALNLVDGSLGMEVSATKSWSKTYERSIADPLLWRLPFTVGPIPVVINFKLPTKVGVQVSTTAVGRTEVSVPWGGSFGFDYRCQADGCAGTSQQSFDFQPPIHNAAQASVEVDLKAKPFLDSRLQANLYSDSIFFANVGLRAGIQNRLWAYFGNDCGDGDGDGINEVVRGAIFDSFFHLELPYGYGGLIPNGGDLVDLYKRSLYFRDFLNPIDNNAIAPVLGGPMTTTQDLPTTYDVSMRPCYPLAQDPTIGLTTDMNNFQGTGAYDLGTGAVEQRIFAFAQSGNRLLKAVNRRDSIGRSIGSYSDLLVEVESDTQTPPDPCDPDCPPTIIYDFLVFQDPFYDSDDLRAAEFEIHYGLGWDIDVSQYPPNTFPDVVLEHSLYEHSDDTEPVLSSWVMRRINLLRDLDNMQSVFDVADFFDFSRKIQKVCVRVDPDENHELTTSDISTEICTQVSSGEPTTEIILTATAENTDDVYLTWNDDTLDASDDSFDLFRSHDDGETFTQLVSDYSNLDYLDVDLPNGDYLYAIDSKGVRYFSNTVTIGGPAPIEFYNDQLSYEGGGPKLSVQITDDLPGSENTHQHEVSINDGPWLDAGLDTLLRIDTGTRLFGLSGTQSVRFRTALWQGNQQVGPWFTSEPYSILLRDWDLQASQGGPGIPWSTIRVDWNEQSDVNLYKLERERLATGQTVLIDVGTSPPFGDDAIEPGETYTYRIRAFDEPWSAPANGFAEIGTLPGTPSFFNASDDILDHVLLTWEALDNVTEYKLYRRESFVSQPLESDLLATVPATSGATAQHFDDDAPVDTNLYYWIRGVNAAGQGNTAYTTGYRPVIGDAVQPNIIMTPLPDAITYSPANPAPGQVISFTIRVRNHGAAPTPAGQSVRLRIQTPAGTVLRSCPIILAGATCTLEHDIVATAGIGQRITVEADPYEQIGESDETDNVREAFFNVGGQVTCEGTWHLTGVGHDYEASATGSVVDNCNVYWGSNQPNGGCWQTTGIDDMDVTWFRDGQQCPVRASAYRPSDGQTFQYDLVIDP